MPLITLKLIGQRIKILSGINMMSRKPFIYLIAVCSKAIKNHREIGVVRLQAFLVPGQLQAF